MKNSTSAPGLIIIPIAIGVAGVLSMTVTARLLQNGKLPMWMISPHEIVNFTFTMQLMILPLSFIAVALIHQYNKENFKTFFRFKIKSEEAEGNWNSMGTVIAIAFTLGNALLMSISVTAQNGLINGTFFKLIPMVLLLSATNAWSEEIFSRLVIVAGLDGKLKPDTICLISAIIFGVPHFFGTPSGLFGIIASGLLGWFLAKSVIETKSLGWALLIHFLQDIVIFGSGAMIIAGNQ